MSIVPVLHATLVAADGDRAALLDGLQQLGVMHLTGLEGPGAVEIDARIRSALAYLSDSPSQHHRVRRDAGFDVERLVTQTEALRARAQALDEERLALKKRIADVQPWGNFVLPDLTDYPELRFWFYRIPPARLSALEESEDPWAIVRRTPAEAFVIVMAEDEPHDLPFARIDFGSRSLAELENRLWEVEVELDDVAAERAGLTRWIDLFAERVDAMLDRAECSQAADALECREAIALLAGWVPKDEADRLARWARANGHALHLREPRAEEAPPTLLRNTPLVQAGESLVTFFTVPAYRAWDPSWLVMATFVVFFALIIGDAVYGAILLAGTALGWRAMGRKPGWERMRVLLALLGTATLAWGAVLGNYAGTPPPAPWLGALQLVPTGDYDLLLRIAIGMGLAHLALANLLAAWHLLPSPQAIARLGWVAVFGAAALWSFAPFAAQILGGAGLVLVVVFTGTSPRIGWRIAEGLMGLTRLISVLGDTLSYLRLFALGIASASLAIAFNELAASVSSVPGAGVALGALILIGGHALNLLLAVAGGVIHGLRLNYIEFFGWALAADEGRPFRHFRKRNAWTR